MFVRLYLKLTQHKTDFLVSLFCVAAYTRPFVSAGTNLKVRDSKHISSAIEINNIATMISRNIVTTKLNQMEVKMAKLNNIFKTLYFFF